MFLSKLNVCAMMDLNGYEISRAINDEHSKLYKPVMCKMLAEEKTM